MPSIKMEGGDCEKGKDTRRVNWTQSDFDTLIDLCIELVEKSKAKTSASTSPRIPWKKLEEDFQKRTKKTWNKSKLKNKYDWMRNRWILWKKLKGKETGLGWNHEKKTISADDEWWETKIQENNHFKVFREEGIEPDLESKMDCIFAHSLATWQFNQTLGEHCSTQNKEGTHISSPQNAANANEVRALISSPQNAANANEDGPHISSPRSAVNANDTESSASPAFDHTAAQIVRVGKRRGKRSFESNDSRSEKSARTNSTIRTEDLQLIGEKLDGLLQAISERDKMMTSFLQSMKASNAPTSSSVKDETVMSIADAVTKLCTLKELVPGSPEFSFAVTIMAEQPMKRIILANLPSDVAIVGWIKFLYADRKRH